MIWYSKINEQMNNIHSSAIDCLETWMRVVNDKVSHNFQNIHSLTFHEENFTLRRIGSVSLAVQSDSCWVGIVFCRKDEDCGNMVLFGVLKCKFESNSKLQRAACVAWQYDRVSPTIKKLRFWIVESDISLIWLYPLWFHLSTSEQQVNASDIVINSTRVLSDSVTSCDFIIRVSFIF